VQPHLCGLVVDELVDEGLEMLGQRDLHRPHEILLTVEIGRRVELVFVNVAEQLLVFF